MIGAWFNLHTTYFAHLHISSGVKHQTHHRKFCRSTESQTSYTGTSSTSNMKCSCLIVSNADCSWLSPAPPPQEHFNLICRNNILNLCHFRVTSTWSDLRDRSWRGRWRRCSGLRRRLFGFVLKPLILYIFGDFWWSSLNQNTTSS